MSIKSQAELKKLQAIGRIVRMTLDEMSAAVHPGTTTGEIDSVGAAALAKYGAESSPPKSTDFRALHASASTTKRYMEYRGAVQLRRAI